jgi:hypothetical protein
MMRGGFEPDRTNTPVDGPSEDNPDDESATTDRIWLIQCKREKTITPKKLAAYLDDIPASDLQTPYGIVFAASCEFSKAAKDIFRSRTRDLGLAEAHLLGKGELEDMLYQPKK